MQVLEKTTGIRTFVAEDMEWLLADGVKELGLKFIPSDQLKEVAKAREDNGHCITLWVDGKIVGCGGVDLLWPGVGEMWLMVSYEADKCKTKAYKLIIAGMDKISRDNNLWRCQAWVRKGNTLSHTLCRHLGFKTEGIAEKYFADGTDAILYAKVK
jgi:hypothetical protein